MHGISVDGKEYALLAIALHPKPILPPIRTLCINDVGTKPVDHEVWKEDFMPRIIEVWIS